MLYATSLVSSSLVFKMPMDLSTTLPPRNSRNKSVGQFLKDQRLRSPERHEYHWCNFFQAEYLDPNQFQRLSNKRNFRVTNFCVCNYLKGKNFRGKKISKFAKINSFFDPRKCRFAKINSREIFQNWRFAKINSREIFQELMKGEYWSLCPRPSDIMSFFK